eukprot:Rmarinus@m.1296
MNSAMLRVSARSLCRWRRNAHSLVTPNYATIRFCSTSDADSKDKSALVHVKAKTTAWDRFRDRMNEHAHSSRIIGRILSAKEDMGQRIEGSDNPIVMKLLEWRERLFGENDQALCLREIQTNDPHFTVETFLQQLEDEVIPQVMQSYLTGEVDNLGTWVAPEAIQAIRAEIAERQAMKAALDPRLLNVQNVDLVAAALMDETPTILVSFVTHLVNCVRNVETGAIIEGAEDDIRAVYYTWALQFAEEDDLEGESGKRKWQISEIVIAGSHPTI